MKIRNLLRNFVMEEDGVGTVELILILVVLIGLVIIFKTQITELVESIFDTINSQAGKITK
ncbi:MAG: hypothetical protein K6A69_01050 [Lachnospiraceae bacterium]|nr:hypothetical protein [Lachnospiraceae bacterium]